MRTMTKGEMMVVILAVDVKPPWHLDFILIPVGRDIPEYDLVAFLNRMPVEIDVGLSRAAHVSDWRLITNDFRYKGTEQIGVCIKHRQLIGVLFDEQGAACQGVTCRIISGNVEY